MKNFFTLTLLTIVILGILAFAMDRFHIVCWSSLTLSTGSISCGTTPSPLRGTDPKNATYNIEGTPVTLVNGVSIVSAAPGSASKVTTRYFGNEVVHDLNGDGRPDTTNVPCRVECN